MKVKTNLYIVQSLQLSYPYLIQYKWKKKIFTYKLFRYWIAVVKIELFSISCDSAIKPIHCKT